MSKLKWLLLRKGLYTELRAYSNKWKGKTVIGKGFSIGKHSILDRYMGGCITIGNGVVVCEKCKIATCGGDITIGNGTAIGDYCTITAQGGVCIGSKVLFADRISIIANEHVYSDVSIPIMDQKSKALPITIGDGTWIGINATILGGTQIGKNCVVAAGAVVKGIFPDNCVLGGIPARIIKRYYSDEKVWR